MSNLEKDIKKVQEAMREIALEWRNSKAFGIKIPYSLCKVMLRIILEQQKLLKNDKTA